jgi:1,4-dihydroxy-2-naphthoate octaprenyltransferase
MDAKTLYIATRPWSFTFTFSSVTVGTLVAFLVGGVSTLLYPIVLYVLVLGGMIALHAATNMINDFYDVKHKVDVIGAPTTKYRPHPVAEGAESPNAIRTWAGIFYALAFVTAACLSFLRGPLVLVLAVAGIAGSFLYTADPLVLKARGLGEVMCFLMWGPLITLGAYVVQTGAPSTLPMIIAIPMGLLIALVVLSNNIRDIEYDGSAGMMTVPVRIGREKGGDLYRALLLMVYLFLPFSIAAGFTPIWSLVVLITIPEALGLSKMFMGQIPDNADPRTAGLALRFSLLYMASLILQIVYPIHIAL